MPKGIYVRTEKHRKAVSELGKKSKGREPWNKGKTGIYSEETLRKMRDNNAKGMKGKIGVDNHGWKGDRAKYQAKHTWIRRNWGKADKCENNSCTYDSPKIYHWANVSGDYLRDRSDWIMLCPSCHYFQNRGLLLIWKR